MFANKRVGTILHEVSLSERQATVSWSLTEVAITTSGAVVLELMYLQELADAALVTMVPLSLLQFAMQIVTAWRWKWWVSGWEADGSRSGIDLGTDL